MKFASTDLDAEFVFDRVLDGDEVDRIQDVIGSVAPRWARKLRVWRSPRAQRPVDVEKTGELALAVFEQAVRRGETYQKLVAKRGAEKELSTVSPDQLNSGGPGPNSLS